VKDAGGSSGQSDAQKGPAPKTLSLIELMPAMAGVTSPASCRMAVLAERQTTEIPSACFPFVRTILKAGD
jgi:hypothetical protein